MIKHFVYLLLLTALSINAYSLNLTAEVDRTELGSNESLRLIVSADENASNTIDFSELTLQFDIINTQRSNQTSIINGKVSTNTQWILILSPKETGTLVIPSFEYRGSYSQAITINVNDSNNQTQNRADRDVFLQVNVNKNKLYVQEQLLVTMRLYYKTALSSYDDEKLKLENTTVTLVSENNFRSSIKGVSYQVLEKIYALHPQYSGDLLIPAQSWRLEKGLNRFNFGRSGNPYLYVRSDPITVDVMPIVKNSTADTWLPSTAITLDGKWQQSIIKAKVGEPLTLELALIANGLAAAQLPDISIPHTDSFTIYDDQPKVDDTKSSIGIIGTRINKFAVIPKEVGTFKFPEIKLTWWNTLRNKEEQAIVPEQTIVVVNSTGESAAQLPSLPRDEAVEIIRTEPKSTLLWKLLSALFFFISLALSYFLYKAYKLKYIANRVQSKPEIKPLKVGKINQLLKQIELAAKQKNWQALRTHIIEWGNQLYKNKEIQSLHEIGELSPELKLDLQQLDKQIYGTNSDERYNPEKLISTIKRIKKIKTVDLLNSEPSALKELYK